MNAWKKCKKKCQTFYDMEKNSRIPQSVPTFYSGLILGIGFIIFILVNWNFTSLPTGLLRSDEVHNQEKFIAERAFDNLRQLTINGPRVAGSDENEIRTVYFLRNAIINVINEKSSVHNIEYNIQSASSSFFHQSGYGVTSIYQGLQNIVVKLSPAGRVQEPENSLLINTHFDSVPTSPGAGDDGSMTVILLEVFRIIAKSSVPLKHSIIFLFNGCEENLLQGSHAFIVQHMWAKHVRAFINLDSCGNGVREIMFQAGPKHPWLMNYYRKTVPHPYASAVAEEMFQANFIPSDTDFRQFRDYGNIPGMDLAQNTNGFVYHTKYDALNSISLESLQNTGDNVLALITALANADELYNVTEHVDGKIIFFDFCHWFLVYYTEVVGIIINYIVAGLSSISIIWSIWTMTNGRDYDKLEVSKEFGLTIIVQALSLGLGIGLVILLAIFYDSVGRSMSWFSSTMLIFGLYFCPLYFVLSVCPAIYLCYKKMKTISLSHQTQLFLNAQCLFLVIFLIIMTVMEIRSAFTVMIPLLFFSVFNLLNTITKIHNKDAIWIFTHLIGQIIPIMFYSSLTLTLFGTFISLTGRFGPSANPEILISIFSIFIGIMLGGFLIPLSILCRHIFIVPMCFLITAIITIILLATPIGFPYSEAQAPQRYFVQHVNRIIHKSDGDKAYSGFFLHSMDRHASSYFDKFLNMYEVKNLHDDCDNEMYCAFPLYRNSDLNNIRSGHWIPSVSPTFKIKTALHNFTIQELGSSEMVRVSFSISGPDHMSLTISPNKNVEIVEWNFLQTIPNSGPKWKDRNVHFINFFYGIDNKPFECCIDIKKLHNWDKSTILSIGLTGHYMHQDIDKTDEFIKFIDGFPKWSAVSNWVSSYESWEF